MFVEAETRLIYAQEYGFGVYYNKILIYPTFYLLRGDYITWHFGELHVTTVRVGALVCIAPIVLLCDTGGAKCLYGAGQPPCFV